MNIYIIDVDNCISNDKHRWAVLPPAARYVNDESISQGATPLESLTDADFEQYHLHSVFDNFHPQNLFYPAHDADRFIFVTAMPEAFRGLRYWWLKNNLPQFIITRSTVLMRTNGDLTPSPELKAGLLRHHFSWLQNGSPEQVKLAVDDRQDVLDAYAEEFDFPTKRVFINE